MASAPALIDMVRRRIALLALLFAGCAAVNANDAVPSGVSGIVTLSPARPGPQRAGQADGRPLAGHEIRLVGADGQFVGRATTADNGRFEIRAPAGRYELQVVVAGPYPRCDATPVSVRVGQMITIAVSCDSGMR